MKQIFLSIGKTVLKVVLVKALIHGLRAAADELEKIDLDKKE
jgi:hypothetical protein